jgi:hypothetical protein
MRFGSPQEYAELELDGRLANMLPPWEDQTYRRPLRVKVRNPDEVPYAVDSTGADLQRVLTEEWPHELCSQRSLRTGSSRTAA